MKCNKKEKVCDICEKDSIKTDVTMKEKKKEEKSKKMNIEQRHEIENTDAAIFMKFQWQIQKQEDLQD